MRYLISIINLILLVLNVEKLNGSHNCNEIKKETPNAESGVYYIEIENDLVEVYCEMVIEGGPYTFLSWLAIAKHPRALYEIFTNRSKFIARFMSREHNDIQPYVIFSQLDMYSNEPISVQINQHIGYDGFYTVEGELNVNIPVNAYLGSYLFISMISSDVIRYNSVLGYKANGEEFRKEQSCDGNTNTYFALFSSLTTNADSYSNYCKTCGNAYKWLNSTIPHPTNTSMPNSYFYQFIEIHFGGCFGYDQSNRWLQFSSMAVGFV